MLRLQNPKQQLQIPHKRHTLCINAFLRFQQALGLDLKPRNLTRASKVKTQIWTGSIKKLITSPKRVCFYGQKLLLLFGLWLRQKDMLGRVFFVSLFLSYGAASEKGKFLIGFTVKIRLI